MKNHQISAAARLDLLNIYNYLAEQASVDVAKRILKQILSEFDRLARNPGLGHKWEDATRRPLLFWRVHAYLIIYERLKKGIRIARVIHGARDLRSALDERS